MNIEGVRGFYRGYLTTVLREIPFSLIQFPLWEKLKKTLKNMNGGRDPTPSESSICGAVSGGISAAITTPLDVAKTRIMLADAGSDIAKKSQTFYTLQSVYAKEGVKGLFAGVTPRVMWISIGGAVFFGMYEKAKDIIQNNL